MPCSSWRRANGGLTLAEGIAVKSPGKLIAKAIIERLVGEVLLVDETAIEHAVSMLVELQKLVAEGAGAAGLAAMIAHPERFKRVGIVVCGGNIDARMLAQVLMRGLVRDGRVVTLRIEISDSPGVLGTLARTIGERRQHHRDPSPAAVLRSAGQARRRRCRGRDAQPGALPRYRSPPPT